MSEIVKNELDAIAEFKELTPRRSTLTLNELNYISDKRLHKEDGGGGGGDFEKASVMITNTSGVSIDISYIKICGDIQVPRPFHKTMGNTIDSLSGILVGSVIVIETAGAFAENIEGDVEAVSDPWGVAAAAVLVNGAGRFGISYRNET